jgi:spore coat polysaccharide biosynthesis protein SpsF
LELVVRRMTESQQLDGVVVVLGAADAALADLAPSNVPLHISDRPDALGRVASAADAFQADAIVRIGAEHPFVDPVLLDRLATTAAAHPRCDYIGFCSQQGRSNLGMFGDWCRTEALWRADREATSAADRDQPTRFLWSHPELFSLRFIPLPSELEREGLRLASGCEEAWEHALTIHDALGHEDVNWRRIAGLLSGVPAAQPAAATAASSTSE